jgi:hypothetical protein
MKAIKSNNRGSYGSKYLNNNMDIKHHIYFENMRDDH